MCCLPSQSWLHFNDRWHFPVVYIVYNLPLLKFAKFFRIFGWKGIYNVTPFGPKQLGKVQVPAVSFWNKKLMREAGLFDVVLFTHNECINSCLPEHRKNQETVFSPLNTLFTQHLSQKISGFSQGYTTSVVIGAVLTSFLPVSLAFPPLFHRYVKLHN